MGIFGMESRVFDSMTISKRGSQQDFHRFLTHHGDFLRRGSRTSGDLTSLRSTDWTADWGLQFHQVHGDNVEISPNKSQARRADSFCKGICFSNRPVAINEKVYIRFAETSSSWSGVLRFGFTSVDPGSVRGGDLPRYACPDLTNKPGHWAKALGERYAAANNILHYYVTRTGDVMYGINGDDKGLFFSGVCTNGPLWTLLDIYGNTMVIEFTLPERTTLNNMVGSPVHSGIGISNSQQDLVRSISSLSVGGHGDSSPSLPVVRYHSASDFIPLQFHSLTGKNLQMSCDRTVAHRVPDEYCNGYVFSSRPVRCGEKIVLQVLGVDRSYVGGLAFGFTACDPSTVNSNDLPDDSDLLLDRSEYWVVNKDVCRNLEIGDELSFYLTNEGEVRYSRNNNKVATLMHVDRTLPLWAFFDVYGNVQKVKLLGITIPMPNRPHLPRSRSASSYPDSSGLMVSLPPPPSRQSMAAPDTHIHPQPPTMMRSYSVPSTAFAGTQVPMKAPLPPKPASMPTSPLGDEGDVDERSECTVCYEKPVNAVLYTCGHLCMCYDCAIVVQRDKGALCPICRQQIKDVIKIYRT